MHGEGALAPEGPHWATLLSVMENKWRERTSLIVLDGKLFQAQLHCSVVLGKSLCLSEPVSSPDRGALREIQWDHRQHHCLLKEEMSERERRRSRCPLPPFYSWGN